MEANEPLVRYSEPSQYDQMPYGTKIVVMKSVGNADKQCAISIYIQISQDESKPNWELIETVSDEHNN